MEEKARPELKEDGGYDEDGNWTMPTWLEPYREYVEALGGGNPAERLMTVLETQEHLAFSNAVLFTLAAQTSARVGLLRQLRRDGLLLEPRPAGAEGGR